MNEQQARVDMASAVLSTKNFHGDITEDVNQWLRTVKMNSMVAALTSQETLQLTILKLRDTAQLCQVKSWIGTRIFLT
ncbi:hypothetical protein COBT_002682 [Conglomerata obtusa]